MRKKPIVALIYDFDGTLSPRNMQEFGFVQELGFTAGEFWQKSDEIAIKNDASNILAYMKLMLDESKARNIRLTREYLQGFGKTVDFFQGVKEWFKLINAYGKSQGVVVEHYINSSGLKEIIEGTSIADEFKHIFACTFIYNEKGEATWPGVCLDYTAKTQFIFKINKGIMCARDAVKVNASTSEDKKRIPFPNMIYFGDGDTDVPSMKVINMFGGHSIAVYNPENQKQKTRAKKLLNQGRVNFITDADYRYGSRAYKIICSIIDKIKSDHVLKAF